MSAGDLPRIGLRLSGALDPRACVALAEAAEASGLASVWFAENPFQRGLLPATAAAALATRRVGIGIGVVNPYNRHPTLIAMEFAALDELAGGRARLGIGSGIRGAVARMGLAGDHPLAAVRDAIHIVRGMLHGDAVAYRGRMFSAVGARLAFPALRPDAPIYIAAMGPQSLRLAGRIGDGLILSNICPAVYAAEAVVAARVAAAAAGRALPEIVQYAPCAARPDREAARRAVRPALAALIAALWPEGDAWPVSREGVVRASGIPRGDFAAALALLRRGEPATDALDDRFVDAFAVAGTAADCLARARQYRAAGVTELALGFAGSEARADIAYLGAALAVS